MYSVRIIHKICFNTLGLTLREHLIVSNGALAEGEKVTSFETTKILYFTQQ